MIEVELSPRARREVRKIAGYLRRESSNLVLGLRFATAVGTTLLRVSEFPLTGKKVGTRQRKFAELRAIPVNGFPNYIIYYLPSRDVVRVLRVLHGARNLPRVLGVE